MSECGVRTRMVSPSEAVEIVPGLTVSGVHVGSYDPDDGVLFPWPFIRGYAHKALELGVRVYPDRFQHGIAEKNETMVVG